MWLALAMIVFVLVCLALCFFVLIQNDKGGGISGAIGGGMASAGNVLGTRDTANFLTRATTYLAIGFMGLCLLISFVLSNTGRGAQEQSILEQPRTDAQQNYMTPGTAFDENSLLGGQDLESMVADSAAIAGQPETSEENVQQENTTE